MRPLAALERFLERLFERPAARLLHVRLEPVTVVRRLERAIDESRRVGADGTIAPTRFTVRVSPGDAAALAAIGTLEEDLAAAALEHARRRGYRIPERPTVALVGAREVEPGGIAVLVGFVDARHAPADDEIRLDRTLVHPLPPVVPPGASLRVGVAGKPARDLPLDGSQMAIGRAADADVVLADPLVSRHHARLAARGGRFVLTDLGSTNGTRVNGNPVTEAVVGPGDRIEIGSTRLEIVVPGAGAGAARAAATGR